MKTEPNDAQEGAEPTRGPKGSAGANGVRSSVLILARESRCRAERGARAEPQR